MTGGADLAGAGDERPDVLRQAAAAEADAGVEEPPADAGVVADRIGELGDVGACHLTISAIALMNEILVARNALATP